MMGKPNFGFQKRQKELARQKKKEEKKQRKQEKSAPERADEIVVPADEGTAVEHSDAESGAEGDS